MEKRNRKKQLIHQDQKKNLKIGGKISHAVRIHRMAEEGKLLLKFTQSENLNGRKMFNVQTSTKV